MPICDDFLDSLDDGIRCNLSKIAISDLESPCHQTHNSHRPDHSSHHLITLRLHEPARNLQPGEAQHRYETGYAFHHCSRKRGWAGHPNLLYPNGPQFFFPIPFCRRPWHWAWWVFWEAMKGNSGELCLCSAHHFVGEEDSPQSPQQIAAHAPGLSMAEKLFTWFIGNVNVVSSVSLLAGITLDGYMIWWSCFRSVSLMEYMKSVRLTIFEGRVSLLRERQTKYTKIVCLIHAQRTLPITDSTFNHAGGK